MLDAFSVGFGFDERGRTGMCFSAPHFGLRPRLEFVARFEIFAGMRSPAVILVRFRRA
ncbi:MAG: hypothetical protein RJA59_1675, partial [Pseudomonadota bacterium]